VLNGVSAKTAKECYNDATYYRDEIRQLFGRGQIALRSLSLAESTYLHIVWAIVGVLQRVRRVPAGFEGLEESLADIYYGNFSVFQSLPDVWAIDQVFPIIPVHRHNEPPTRRAIFADITCDSDGKVDQFIDRRDVKKTLESAIANAENNHDLDVDALIVSEAYVGKKLVMKRLRARARGRAARIEKPFAQITVVVRQVEESA